MSLARLIGLAAIVGMMWFLVRDVPSSFTAPGAAATLAFGFMILAAYLLAGLLKRLGLPLITGYIATGVVCGPSVLGLLSRSVVQDLKLVDDLALTFIALAAGGELRMGMLRQRRRSIVLTLVCLVGVVLFGVPLALLPLRAAFPYTANLSLGPSLGVLAIAGALAVARSPSSAIAIISETKARGPFTEMVLGVTVAADVLAILVFAIAVSVAEVLVTPGKTLNLLFLGNIAVEVVVSLLLGLLLGKGIALYLERVRAELTIFTLGVAFLVAKLCHGLAGLLQTHLDVRCHLEPMMICMAAGFVVQNFSRGGDGFLKVIDRSSLPIYTIFFAMSGASLQLEALRTTWHWALAMVALRACFIYTGCSLGGRLAGDPPRFRRVSGISFITQAGVSLGLVKVIMDKFPGFGPAFATLLVATIAINQILGPVGFKVALSYVGETREARIGARALQR